MIRRPPRSTHCISSAASDVYKRQVSGSDDCSIIVWKLETGEIVRTLTGHEQSVYCVQVTPDQKFIISGSDDRSIKTVSYTHLRAHETRHDLVCRLLLEKKKTKSKKKKTVG
eukprot:TRINITY_DN12705_c0_g1_i1.p2 TRINITY_DN12705_c0_g1~~TRINITY_DN12705_c0_g1_i1.p2  ORF type:complete len:112 (-),score=32.44 TRINITY_DN12705_c0_g1_i1:29-364(-)